MLAGPDNEWHNVCSIFQTTQKVIYTFSKLRNYIFVFFVTVMMVSVMISILTKILSFQFIWQISWQYPTFPAPALHTPATTLASSNQTNCPQTASYNLGTNLPKMSLQFSCHNARFCSLLVFSLLLHSARLLNLCWSWFQWIKSGNQRSDGYVVINDEHERILIWCLNIKVILIDKKSLTECWCWRWLFKYFYSPRLP